MKKWLKNKAGVTLLEGLIALLLLSIVATGTLGVLLSISRKTNTTEMEAAMMSAIEQARNVLKYHQDDLSNYSACGGSDYDDLTCFLPSMCDRYRSSFSYSLNSSYKHEIDLPDHDKDANLTDLLNSNDEVSVPHLTFQISCNGYTL